ncbi:uncharacterized protein [Mycetomoellerius zeteki]|uniref:uncharacterized protein n=1 Tax=Mycetomoellerius zeteki TaxID=64791 RepID=UPI00084E46C6|nr:PREDICTED: uncharacterized protein LOC108723882 [Trachymyrmex zeteki]
MTRLTVEQIEELLNLLHPALTKASMREFLHPEFRLAFTLCFLASGDSLNSMARYWRIGKSTSYKIVIETCNAIWQCLKKTYLKQPSEEEWKNIEKCFYERWDFPNCIGALDGKHIRVQCPPNSGSAYYNYKGYYSLVLATCDANYAFTFVDIGDYGSLSDTSILSVSGFGQALEHDELNLPPPKLLPKSTILAHHYFVGDEIFPLRLNLLRPYARKNLLGIKQKVFNYRLSRARRTIENAFGILVTRWRVLRTTLAMHPNNVEAVISAAVCLHNFIMKWEEHTIGFQSYCPPGYVDHYNEDGNVVSGLWRDENVPRCITRLNRVGSNRAATISLEQQDTISEYFMTNEGQIPWQWYIVYAEIA